MKLRSILAFARSVAKARALTLQDDETDDCHSGTKRKRSDRISKGRDPIANAPG